MNARESIVYCESIERENNARKTWMATHGKELGLDEKLARRAKEREQEKKKKKAQPQKKVEEDEEDEEVEETRPLSLVYNQERYPVRYDMAAWGDAAIRSGYNKINFRC
eukprot:TRINITY_DN623_c0_g1_i2.p1 TRINITY_DN623_c0_g1~~TRINITY_DN623_c0_g1_i2.p1  ORF type:complete len:109 (-),score=42.20 TRINITY_DN623_c0_g1_i2:256-582(-)